MEDLNKKVVVSVKERLPRAKQSVIVVCETFRCLGYVDEKGVWRDVANSKELEGVIGWMEGV